MSSTNSQKLPVQPEAATVENSTTQTAAAPERPGWMRCKAGVALHNRLDKFILVKEACAPQPANTDSPETVAAETDGKWKLPYGGLWEWDGLPTYVPNAASVIGTKLSCYDFDEQGVCYIGFTWNDPCLIIIYAANQPYDLSLTDLPDPDKVAAVAWFSYEEILKLNEEGMLRDPEVVLTAIGNIQKGTIIPSDAIATYTPK